MITTPLAGAADAPDVPASPMLPTAKPTIKIIRIMVYLPKEKTVPDDLQGVGHRTYQVSPTCSCSAPSPHTFASASWPLITGSRPLVGCSAEREERSTSDGTCALATLAMSIIQRLGAPHCPSRKGDRDGRLGLRFGLAVFPLVRGVSTDRRVPGIAGSAPVIPWLDQFPSIAPY